MSATLDYTPEQAAALERARQLADRFYDEHIKPTARESTGRPAAEDPDRCHCATPLPKRLDDRHICTTCMLNLRTDPEGNAYRRFRGDLDTDEQRRGREVLEATAKAKAEMLELVNSLPAEQQRRLMALPNRKFAKVARAMINRREAIARAEKAGVPLGPNARRRLQRQGERMADVIDGIMATVQENIKRGAQ